MQKELCDVLTVVYPHGLVKEAQLILSAGRQIEISHWNWFSFVLSCAYWLHHILVSC
jgi:hypothetical protein